MQIIITSQEPITIPAPWIELSRSQHSLFLGARRSARLGWCELDAYENAPSEAFSIAAGIVIEIVSIPLVHECSI